MTNASLPCVADENGNYSFSRPTSPEEIIRLAASILEDRSQGEASTQDCQQDAFMADINLLLGYAAGDSEAQRELSLFILSLWNGDIFQVDMRRLVCLPLEIHTVLLRVLAYLNTNDTVLTSYLEDHQIKPLTNWLSDSFSWSFKRVP